MGTKKGSMERKKLHSEDKDSSVDIQRSDDVTFNLEGDANPNSHETGKREKRKKRKSDNGDGDVESQKALEKDLVEKNFGDDIVEKDKSGKNTIAKHRFGVEAAENDATEGMSRAKDGSEDEKKRKKKKKKEKNVDGNELSGGRNDGKKVGNERENFMEVGTENGGVMDASENDATERMPRAKDGTEEEKKRKKKKKREKDVDGKELAGGRNGGKKVGNEREYDMEKETENGGVMDASENGTGESMDGTEDGTRDEKRRKKKKRERDGDTGLTSNEIVRKEAGTERELFEDNNLENVEPSRKKRKQKDEHNVEKKDKKKKKKRETDGDTGLVSSGIVGKETETERELLEENNLENVEPSRKKKKQKNEHNVEKKKDKKKKRKKRKKGNSSDDEATGRTSKGASKRVSFSENIEIFPSSDGPSNEGSTENHELVRGKRFSQEEDEILRAAVLSYIDQHGLGEEGIKMILKCKKHPEVRNCWKDIAAALPWRPSESVYHRAHVLFERDENRKWTEEEYELVRKFHEKYGADWRTLGDALGKHRFHVKDAWRRINVANRKRGHWSQDEYQSLFDLVNMDLRMRVFEERKSKHGMLRDNISWTAISNKMGTRAMAMCCMKWYDSLSSPMVAEGKWLDLDDYRLMLALYELDACCMEDIDWDSLLEHRPGDVCRKRWNQMVKHLGELQNGSFSDQVEVLMQRYCPDVLEARETYDNKPVVD